MKQKAKKVKKKTKLCKFKLDPKKCIYRSAYLHDGGIYYSCPKNPGVDCEDQS